MELRPTQRVILRIGLLIAGCTILLTSSFVGVLAVLAGEIDGYASRIAWYMVGTAILFVATIVLLELNDADGYTIIVTAIVAGILSFALLSLGFEGLLYAISNPDEVFVSQLIVYFFAAALIGTGVGYWGLRHWREFTPDQPHSR